MYYIVRILYKKLYASCAKNLNKTVPIRMFVLEDILMRKYLTSEPEYFNAISAIRILSV